MNKQKASRERTGKEAVEARQFWALDFRKTPPPRGLVTCNIIFLSIGTVGYAVIFGFTGILTLINGYLTGDATIVGSAIAYLFFAFFFWFVVGRPSMWALYRARKEMIAEEGEK